MSDPAGDAPTSRVGKALVAIGAIALCGLTCAALYGGAVRPSGTASRWIGALIAVLAGGAAFAVGGMLGLLFGSPSLNTTGSDKPSVGVVTPNSRLDKVAEWLTTMIVGVSLTNLPTIEDRTRKIGVWLTQAVSGDGKVTNGMPGVVLALGFAIAGFFYVYLWSLRFLPAEIRDAFGDLQTKANQLASLSSTLDVKLDEIRTKAIWPVDAGTLAELKASMQAADVDAASIDEIISRYSGAKAIVDEPMKDFGPQAAGGYSLDAAVEDVGGDKYRLTLQVTSASGETPPHGFWLFHNSFMPDITRECPFKGGPARMTYEGVVDEAFNVGAIIPWPGRPAIRLGYDLRLVPEAPQKWKDTPEGRVPAKLAPFGPREDPAS